MALSLTATGIQSDAADTGTYTWADVVALNSPSMTAQTATNGRTIYRWTGTLTMLGTSILNITNETIELLAGKFRANESSTINLGQVSTVLGQTVYSSGCQILVANNNDQSGDDSQSNLSYLTGSNRTSTTSKINIYNSVVELKSGSVRCNLFLSNIYNSLLYADSRDTGVSFVYLQSGGTLSKTKFTKLSIELAGAGVSVNELETVIPKFAFLNYTGQRQIFRGVISKTASDYDYNVSSDSPIDFIDSIIDLTRGHIQLLTGTLLQSRRLASQYLKIQSGSTVIVNAYVAYSGRTNVNSVTASDGLFSANLVYQETNNTINPGYSNFYAEPTPIVGYSAYTREIRSYLHLGVLETVAVDSQIGNPFQPFIYSLTVDSGITQTVQATAAAITAITHTAIAVTVTASRSIADMYDSRKAYWRDNGGATGQRIGAIADFETLNVTIAAGAAISPSIAKFLDGIQTAGIITLTDPRAYNGVPFTIATGGSVMVLSGNYDLRSWSFAAGTVINRSGASSAIVTVAADQLANVAVGAGVTIQAPQASIRFFGIPNVANAIISVQDLTSLAITYPSIVAGEVTIPVNAARSYKIRADAPGYLASRFFTIPGTTPEFQFSLADYRTLYLSGVNRASQISFNPTTFVITISDLTLSLSFADVFRTIEDYLASQQGLAYTAHPFPIVLPSKNLLWFPFDTTANAVNPARIKPAATNLADPELLFETFLEGAADTTYGLFDFTGAGGRIIRIRSAVAIAQVQGDGSFTISDRTKLDGLNATLISSGVFSAPSLVNAPAGGSGTADWTTTERGQIRKRLGIDGTAATPIATPDLALGSAISAIPTNPLLATDTRLNNLDASVSSRLASAGYATPPNVAAITSAVWANAARELTSGANIVLAKGSGITGLNDITAQSVLSVPTSSQITAGTIGKLFADNLNAPISAVPTNPLLATDTRINSLDAAISSRSTQSSVTAIPTNPVLTSDSRLNFLDASIAANAPINVWNFGARTLTSTGSTLTASDVWNFGARSLTTPFPTVPTVSQTATAVRTELSIELGRIDRAVSSVFTSGDRAVLSAIPTNTYTITLSSIQSSISALPTLAAIEGSIVLFKINNYTAPDNAGIGSLNSKLTPARADGFDRLPNLDALITSRTTPDQVWAVPYSGLTQVGTIGRLLYWIGKLFGVTSTSVTASDTARITGDGTINQPITTNSDGSSTMSGSP